MTFHAIKTTLPQILPWRNLFLQETNFQIRYHSCHERGWSDSYLLRIDDDAIGYGAIKGKEQRSDRDAIFEFYIIPPYRKYSGQLFAQLLATAGATWIECQSNDLLLSAMAYESSQHIRANTILFGDRHTTFLDLPGTTFRPIREDDKIFEHKSEPEGSFVLEKKGAVLATGGFLLHYNMPFADLYMEVREDARKSGLGGFLIQELKKACYWSGRVPAARCNIDNAASKATLLKAGLGICGYMLDCKL
ncbi:MAG TPA: hypothetical protein VK543_00935 [Puia sp.]|nr:hypothetical protein [Puia sp.]